ncbi:ABC transporter ATP-binding protein [Hymenobacter sp. GOD-10R]|uniref:ABC transporter ATP-binding protein n=1 Tax=Hymenobacter sp. GOD-10R TaxID=3093922 RepID=UPI002D77DFE3|nr:ABC transporter ATP-binding protein [Hymenobacter sp. GOD-10R]WRQ29019.1 ABC transporter ATP-binding protein [Hymenobacter sp. GOD-10R]
MMAPPPLLETQALVIGYKLSRTERRHVAGPLDLALQPGDLVCLLGPNGAGKSTLMRTLAGLQPPLGGHVQIEQVDTQHLAAAELARKLSIVLTDRVEAGNLTVQELVALGRYPHTGWLGNLSAHDHTVIQEALASTNTAQFAARRVATLSDGERQKVMLARALAQDTPVILLDEPTAHLDLPNRVQLMRLLHQLARQTRKAILLSTHELDLALQAADYVWLMHGQGQLHTGVPEDLVLSGTFEAAFARDGLAFDQATGTFVIHEPGARAVHLDGSGPLAFWTQRALQREGFKLTTEPGTGLRVELREQASSGRWVSHLAGQAHEHHSIADLLAYLRVTSAPSPR